jgi:hypothetical protein
MFSVTVLFTDAIEKFIKYWESWFPGGTNDTHFGSLDLSWARQSSFDAEKKQSKSFLPVSGTRKLLANHFCNSCLAWPRESKLASLQLPGNKEYEYVFKIFQHVCEWIGNANHTMSLK